MVMLTVSEVKLINKTASGVQIASAGGVVCGSSTVLFG
jgi:hypothetical protein